MHLYNHYFKKPLVVLGLLGISTACEPEIERDAPSYEEARGDADFTTYVALGNSLTAGYADGALNRQNQLWSYPAIMAEQIQYIKPDLNFTQPLLPEGRANGTLYIQSFVNGRPVLLPEIGGLSQQEIFAPVSGTFQNLGVPGAKVGDLTMPGYGSSQGNPYFARFASAPTVTMVEMAASQNPTFFTLWIGNNDVLGFATAGGQFMNAEGVIEGPSITDPASFRTSYEAIINQLKASNASIEGAVANIPAISKIPYFNTVPWNAF
ncbi:MAG: G-D-S-L family lipolytic protein, partial [Bacteroidetes bacterium]|nr:G-D-S-L family lipolytic protein [Bacteroidota bacterium]